MKLAIFYPRNTLAGWYSLGGYADTLRRMGHEVLDVWLPGNEPHPDTDLAARLPKVEDLESCQAVLSLYHEYTQPWLAYVYGEKWLELKVPTVARYDESMDRVDLNLPNRMEILLQWAKHHSFPAVQDAKKYGGQFLPFGADITMFKPQGRPERMRWPLAFVGTLYPSRMQYLQGLAGHLGNETTFFCGPVGHYELGGMKEPESTHLLIHAYRHIGVFFCLPPLSRLTVAKVFDVMACGTFVMIPRLHGECADNMVFENNRHVVYYEPGYMRENAKQIQRWLKNDGSERDTIALAGMNKVREDYSLEKMLQGILANVHLLVEA